MKKFYLIRHAQSESNAGIVIRPNPIISLTALGKEQASALSHWLIEHLPSPDGVMVSPYVRTHQTAKPYLEYLNQSAQVMPSLQEFNMLKFAHIENQPLAKIRKMAQQFWLMPNDHKDGDDTDSFDEFVARVQSARQTFATLPDGTYAIFTHGMWIGMLIWQLLHKDSPKIHDKTAFATYELTIRPDNCDVYLFSIAQGVESISKVRDTHSEQNSALM